ncbi:hypothetical protein [Thermogutta sp.]|uniref:hypothetical protein n=1 Tax=Thermogutta sp. TaxID=1962930 RepID=UPI003C7E447F
MLVTSASAEERKSPSPFDEAIDFVQKHLNGKTLYQHTTIRFDQGGVESQIETRTMYMDLVRTSDMAMLHDVVIVHQKLWDLDESGKRISETPRIFDRVLVSRYCFRKSKATSEALGTVVPIVNSAAGTWGVTTEARLRVVEGKLRLELGEHDFYGDGFAKGGGYRPIRIQVVKIFNVLDGKLMEESVIKAYEVDPETLKPTSEPE